MTQPPTDQGLVQQVSRLIIENRSEDGNITPTDQPSLRDDVLALIAHEREAAADEAENLLLTFLIAAAEHQPLTVAFLTGFKASSDTPNQQETKHE